MAKDFSNLIGGEQKFVHMAFTLEVNSLQNVYMTKLFGSFGVKSLYTILMESQIPLEQINFSFQIYTISTIFIFY
jgi:hypothetical protein